MKQVWILGSPSALGCTLALARQLARAGTVCLVAVPEHHASLRAALSAVARGLDAERTAAERGSSQLGLMTLNEALRAVLPDAAHELWIFPGAGAAQCSSLLEALRAAEAASIDVQRVVSSNTEAASDGTAVDAALVARSCAGRVHTYRSFAISPTFQAGCAGFGGELDVMGGFLSELHDMKREIVGRVPGYLAAHPLTLSATEGAWIEVMTCWSAVEAMTRVQAEGQGGHRLVRPGRAVLLAELLGALHGAYEVELRPSPEHSQVNVIERRVDTVFDPLRIHLCGSREQARPPGAGDDVLVDVELASLWAAFRQASELADAEAEQRHTEALARFACFEEKLVERPHGDVMTYKVAGVGSTPLLILNALGQGEAYWRPLLGRLALEHRVVYWSPRGTYDAAQPLRMQEQLEDALAVLQQEGIERCLVVAWCTGAKLAAELYRHHPRFVRGLVYLCPSFQSLNGEARPMTVFEKDLLDLCAIVNRNPRAANVVTQALGVSIPISGVDLSKFVDQQQLAVEVSSALPRDLREAVVAPFRDEATVLRYSRQAWDVWGHDPICDAHEVDVPVTIVTGDSDRIVSTDFIRRAAPRFRYIEYLEWAGATHYLHYERPDAVQAVIRRAHAALSDAAPMRTPATPTGVDERSTCTA